MIAVVLNSLKPLTFLPTKDEVCIPPHESWVHLSCFDQETSQNYCVTHERAQS